jgi:hypothetical protein
MKYLCPCFNEVTGERLELLVDLGANEVADAMRHLALRGAGGPGGPNGPIARGYAIRRASLETPPGFVVVIEQTQCVALN